MNALKVSVITPFFNREEFLHETIESVIAQTYSNWELILVDDGSQDNSREIALHYVNQYPDKIYYFCHPHNENRGAGASRNLGLRHAQGDVIFFLDSDDLVLPEKLETYLPLFELNPDADALFSETLYWYSWKFDSEMIKKDWLWHPWKDYGLQPGVLIKSPELIYPLLVHSVMPCLHSLIIKRDKVESIGGWEENYKYSYNDQVFYLKIFLKGSVYIASGCYDLYRQHANSMGNNVINNGMHLHDRINFLCWVEKYLSNEGYKDESILEYLQNELKPYRNPNCEKKIDIPVQIGQKSFGDLHRLKPLSRLWGFDRGKSLFQKGQPIDRYYIENFLESHSTDIKGNVLEIGDSGYTLKYGENRIISADVLDANPLNSHATYVYDLAVGGIGFPKNRYDCFLLIQTLLLIYDIKSATKNAYKVLKPGGILLVTLPGISQICRPEMEIWGDYWRFTDASVMRLFGEIFGAENITVETYGNVFSATAFLYGLSSHEIKKEELDYKDSDYQVTIAIRAVKSLTKQGKLIIIYKKIREKIRKLYYKFFKPQN